MASNSCKCVDKILQVVDAEMEKVEGLVNADLTAHGVTLDTVLAAHTEWLEKRMMPLLQDATFKHRPYLKVAAADLDKLLMSAIWSHAFASFLRARYAHREKAHEQEPTTDPTSTIDPKRN